MNNKVNFLRGTATEYESSIKDNDTFYYTTDDEKLYLGNKEITGGGVTIDDTLSDTSKNPVQNKVINAALNNKANLSDIPTTLPANGGNSDTLDGRHGGRIPTQNASGNYWNENSTDINDAFIQWDGSTYFKLKTVGGNLTMVDNADTLDGKHADEFLYANGFAGQLAKLFSQPANDDELATLFSVVPDDATLNDLNPGVYIVNTSVARKSLGVPDEIQLSGPPTISEDTALRPGGILIKFGSVLGNPGYSVLVTSGAITPSPFMNSCAFFISNNGSLYRAKSIIRTRVQVNDQVASYKSETTWKWNALVFEEYSNNSQFTIQKIKYLSSEVVISPNAFYLMDTTKAQYSLPYTSGVAYGPTQSYPLVLYNDGLCIRNSGSENLILPAGQYLIHAT